MRIQNASRPSQQKLQPLNGAKDAHSRSRAQLEELTDRYLPKSELRLKAAHDRKREFEYAQFSAQQTRLKERQAKIYREKDKKLNARIANATADSERTRIENSTQELEDLIKEVEERHERDRALIEGFKRGQHRIVVKPSSDK